MSEALSGHGLSEADLERFWSKVDKTPGLGPNGDCWEWKACASSNGYGSFTLDGISRRANRLSFCIANNINIDYLFSDFIIRHTCDNKKCVNPNHLIPGTNKDNSVDAVERRRDSRYISHKDVESIRFAYFIDSESIKSISKRLNYNTRRVSKVVNNKSYKSPECQLLLEGKGLYNKNMRPIVDIDQNKINTFFDRICKDDIGCWKWNGTINRSGYGYFGKYISGKYIHLLAHVFSYCYHNGLKYGEIENGLVVRHLCHNKTCCRPDHLKLGTYKDNVQDAIKNEKFGAMKLSYEKAKEIRRLHVEQNLSRVSLAKMFNVSLMNVSRIISNKSFFDPDYTPPNKAKNFSDMPAQTK